MTNDSRAKEVMQYSFLVALANDSVIDENEFRFIRKQVLADGVIDDAERDIIRKILDRVDRDKQDPEILAQMEAFLEQHLK